MPITRDRLFLLQTDFADPAHDGKVFYCEHCIIMEGVLSAFPDLKEKLEVVRVAWPRPRQLVVDLIGVENQSLPVLILADDAPQTLKSQSHNDVRFENDKDAILELMAVRYGISRPHP